MITPATEEFPEIEWDQKELLEKDLEERSESWLMEGRDAAGNLYSAIGEYICDELEAITYIELEKSQQ